MNKPPAYLEYAFMFDSTKIWGNVREFEHFLQRALKAEGLSGQFLQTALSQKKVVQVDKADNSLI